MYNILLFSVAFIACLVLEYMSSGVLSDGIVPGIVIGIGFVLGRILYLKHLKPHRP